MAGAYVGPLLEAIGAISAELDQQKRLIGAIAEAVEHFAVLHDACKSEKFDPSVLAEIAEEARNGA